MLKEAYKEEISRINSEIELIQRLKLVNQELKKYNWVFLHPYSYGGQINAIELYFKKSKNLENDIHNFFASKFLDLGFTINLIHGFFKTRPFIQDYVNTIEESVILCLQKDFKGAIFILLPVIEGSLRKYLISKKGHKMNTEIKMKELIKAFEFMTHDYINIQKEHIKTRNNNLIIQNTFFDQNQEKQILNKYRIYFTLWIEEVKFFLTNTLYANTKKDIITDNFNRHLIFHALSDDINYSFINYIRLFNCINYLSWSFGIISHNCSPLPEIKSDFFNTKLKDYINILAVSESLTPIKNRIYDHKLESFTKYLDAEYKKAIKNPTHVLKIILTLNSIRL